MGFRRVDFSTAESSGHRLRQDRLEDPAVVGLNNLTMREAVRLANSVVNPRTACLLPPGALRCRVTLRYSAGLAREDPSLLT